MTPSADMVGLADLLDGVANHLLRRGITDGSAAKLATISNELRALAGAEVGGWLPIESCPYHQIVLLLCPERGAWAETTWPGRRHGGDGRNCGYDEAFSIATPYGHPEGGLTKQVWCPIEDQKHWPTHWQPLTPPPGSGRGGENENG